MLNFQIGQQPVLTHENNDTLEQASEPNKESAPRRIVASAIHAGELDKLRTSRVTQSSNLVAKKPTATHRPMRISPGALGHIIQLDQACYGSRAWRKYVQSTDISVLLTETFIAARPHQPMTACIDLCNPQNISEFNVEYQFPRRDKKIFRNMAVACDHYNIPLHDPNALQARLENILFPEKWHVGTNENPSTSEEYEDRFSEAVDHLEQDAEALKALEHWTAGDNDYTEELNSALTHYAQTGQRISIKDPTNHEAGLDMYEEEKKLRAALDQLPTCKTRTLRFSLLDDAKGISEHLSKYTPGTTATSYPRFMSTTSELHPELGAADTLQMEDSTVHICEFNGISGKPLLFLNPHDEREREVLYHNHSVFLLVATAHATPSESVAANRIASIYAEVKGNPMDANNIHTGEQALYML
ncbi:hypothetical protein KQH49_02365 [Mycetohabitans sp. B5]|uniref:Uncharacterized protein n=1 Tax=Mycetohabitans endofungorum TaxID=417203 RepID=A0A2P5KEB2_9BURK|nr:MULTISPECIES: hypothetical protein [Mycetohabitans]MCG1053872.1 hypothetical protein [Mycetohabitans sp. B5]PPB85038.1 hypothetical protein B0O95_101122 [Mycetohabitans endofungorum]